MTLADVRRFWNTRPCNARHSKVDIDDWPLGYHQEVTQRKYMVEPHIAPFSEFPRWRGCRVLEAGCGIGTTAITFAMNGAQVVAVDISEKSVEIARKRARALRLGEDQIRFIVSPIEELSRYLPRAEWFDLVYSFGVIHHTPYPREALLELRQFVRPTDAGMMKLMLYHKVSWKVLWIVLNRWMGRFHAPRGGGLDRLIREHSEAQTGCPVTHTYTRKGARDLLAGCGLQIVNMGIDHIFPYNISAYVFGRYEREWYWKILPAQVFRLLERHFGWHMLIDAVPDPSRGIRRWLANLPRVRSSKRC